MSYNGGYLLRYAQPMSKSNQSIYLVEGRILEERNSNWMRIGKSVSRAPQRVKAANNQDQFLSNKTIEPRRIFPALREIYKTASS